VDPSTVIYDLEGELFFGAAPELDRYFDTLRSKIHTDGIQVVILRLKRVRDPDAVCIERLEHFLREENGREVNGHRVTILLAGIRPDALKVLRNIGFQDWFPKEQVFPEEIEEYSATLKAVRFARAKLSSDEPGQPVAEPERERSPDPLYYLV
jgi:SulP family sulfate permease